MTVTAPPPVTVTQAAPPPVTVAAPPVAAPPERGALLVCPDGHSGVATSVTSCQFAMNVRISYLSQGATQLDGVVHYAIRIGLADVGLAHS